MKPNLQDYPKFYRWLTLPFTRKPHRVQVLQRTNLRPGLLLAIFKENFNGRHLAFYLDSSFGLCLV